LGSVPLSPTWTSAMPSGQLPSYHWSEHFKYGKHWNGYEMNRV
jgi:hypothetical protein